MQWLYFHHTEIFKLPPELWRFVTSFLLTGPKLGIVMDTYFIFQYLTQLETTHPKFNRKEDLLWYLVFCGTVIVVRVAPKKPPLPVFTFHKYHPLPSPRYAVPGISCTSTYLPE